MATPIDSNLISIKDLSEEFIPHLLDYWFHSPPGVVEARGVDLAKMPTELEMKNMLTEKCRTNATLPVSKINSVGILYDGEPVGFHSLNPFTEGDFGIFHAHIFRVDMRKRGVALHSYPKACATFMQRFNLQRILFKTPVQNIGAIRVKEKLGIRYIGEELISFGIIKDGTRAKVFEWTREELLSGAASISPS